MSDNKILNTLSIINQGYKTIFELIFLRNKHKLQCKSKVQRRIKTKANIYDGAFLGKWLTIFTKKLIHRFLTKFHKLKSVK